MLNKKIIPSKIGTPQGSSSIMSPVISNIVLHELDLFMSRTKDKFDIGKIRRRNPKFHSLSSSRLKSTNPVAGPSGACYAGLRSSRLNDEEGRLNNSLPSGKNMLKLPSLKRDLILPKLKRIMYIRYADDFIILVIGSMNDCFNLRRKVKDFLSNKLKLELNVEKTEITNLKKGINFLGSKIILRSRPFAKNRGKVYVNIKNTSKPGLTTTRRRSTTSRRLSILAPLEIIINKLIINGFARKNHLNKTLPRGRRDLTNLSHYDIISFYNSRINGILNYYSFAGNFDQLRRIL